jgi:thiamine biosynthesis protein ThiS
MTAMMEAIQIHVNGEGRGWRSGGTVADLLTELEIRTDRVAVELNLEILDRKEFAQRMLQDGDRVEILSFIGGGVQTVWERSL